MSDRLANFQSYSRYYDLLYKDKDYAGEVAHLLGVLKKNNVPAGDLLEFGSGTGTHGRIFAQHGYTVHGIELSQDMVEKAEITPGFTCQQGDIGQTQMGRIYDAVLSIFHVVSYQTENAQLRAVFDNAASHLNKGGVFIFDVWYSPAVYGQRPSARVKRLSDEEITVTRIAEPRMWLDKNVVEVNYTIFAQSLKTSELDVFREQHNMRHFSLPEIDLLAEASGFERVSASELVTNKAPSESTWGVCVVLRRT